MLAFQIFTFCFSHISAANSRSSSDMHQVNQPSLSCCAAFQVLPFTFCFSHISA